MVVTMSKERGRYRPARVRFEMQGNLEGNTGWFEYRGVSIVQNVSVDCSTALRQSLAALLVASGQLFQLLASEGASPILPNQVVALVFYDDHQRREIKEIAPLHLSSFFILMRWTGFAHFSFEMGWT